MSIKINLVSLHVAAALGTNPFHTPAETAVRPETIKDIRAKEQRRRLNEAMADPNTMIIQAYPLALEDAFSIEPETDTRFSTGPEQKPKAPKKLNNGLDPRLHHG